MKLTSPRRWFKASLVGAVATIGLSAFAQSVSAATPLPDPYLPSGTTGYDASYPQCGATAPAGYAFGIVGVNHGRPFTQNTCVGAEAGATSAPSLYINTGYSGAYRKNITTDCKTQSTSLPGTSAQRQAWAIGCSEAESSYNYAKNDGAASVAMWWLDVETANSWSSSDLTLNQYTINGAASELVTLTTLAGTTLPVGIYSSASYWKAITGTGGFTPTDTQAEWDAANATCPPSGTLGFTGDAVWLAQSTSGGVDTDTAC